MIKPSDLQAIIAILHTVDYIFISRAPYQACSERRTWTQSKKKLKFHDGPETQYLLTTVMEIDARQYARMASAGLFVMSAIEDDVLVTEGRGERKGSFCDGDLLRLRSSVS